ncbi:hypothetical protein IWQ47_002233 [Aquimarina sp. EL_43]|uniref:hypothetical protein n=1 Tax=Aquimarina TaxID=290174 RepID=UPI0004BB53E9|nr:MULTISPECIES: hypothetical protein [Aquimarina]MBG6130769.1 hypothetical protein [Aquimarina sp. EL_35]MBG6151084.1 hypothetical protein [Aquimarina sp. EL_32]MBG6169159.1 hypothetical protein [Aquimarina sp. EL_43]
MLKHLLNLDGIKTLNKTEQKSLKGGWTYVMCHSCDQYLPPGYVCMNQVFCGPN